MTENPTQPDGEASPQDQDLEAQLDDMLNQLGDDAPQPAEPEPFEYKPEESVKPESQSVNDDVPEPVPAQPQAPDPVLAEATTSNESAPEQAESTASSLDPDTLSAMTNDLLSAQIDSTIEAAEAEARIEAYAEDEPLHDPIQPMPTEDAAEDNLDAQIQGLLNEAREQEAVEHQAEADTDMPPTEAVPQEVKAQDVAPEPVEATVKPAIPVDTPEEVEPTEFVAEAAEESTTEQEPAEDVGTVSIDQIDAMLAESAEVAIEHGPTPEPDIPPGTDEVLAAQAKAEEEAEARAKADRDAAEPMPIAVTPEPEPVETKPAEPEPVAAEPAPVATRGATAQDVANELDSDAQAHTKPEEELAEAAFTDTIQDSAADAGFETEPVMVNRSGLEKAERALRIICSKINKPLNGLSPEIRDLVGWFGVGTTGVAFFMLLFGVLF